MDEKQRYVVGPHGPMGPMGPAGMAGPPGEGVEDVQDTLIKLVAHVQILKEEVEALRKVAKQNAKVLENVMKLMLKVHTELL